MATALKQDGATATLSVESDSANVDLTLTPKGTSGDVYSAHDGDLLGGYRQNDDTFFLDNVPASQTNTVVTRGGDSSWGAFDSQLLTVRAGSITGISVISNAAVTAGSITCEVSKDGTGVGLSAVLDTTNTTFKATTQVKDADTFTAGQQLGILLSTPAGFGPTTADIRVVLEYET